MKYNQERIDYYSKILSRNTYFNIYIPEHNADNKENQLLIWLHGWGDPPMCDPIIDYFSHTTTLFYPIIVFPWALEPIEGTEWTNRYDGTCSIEDHVLQEVIPYCCTNHNISRVKQSILIAGVSMGGYAAINIGLKNQEIFAGIFACSPQGLEWPKNLPDKNEVYPDFILEHIPQLTTPYEIAKKLWGDLPENIGHVYKNSPTDYIDDINVNIGIYISVGNQDFELMMKESAEKFVDKLRQKHCTYVFEQLNGGHAVGMEHQYLKRGLEYLISCYVVDGKNKPRH